MASRELVVSIVPTQIPLPSRPTIQTENEVVHLLPIIVLQKSLLQIRSLKLTLIKGTEARRGLRGHSHKLKDYTKGGGGGGIQVSDSHKSFTRGKPWGMRTLLRTFTAVYTIQNESKSHRTHLLHTYSPLVYLLLSPLRRSLGFQAAPMTHPVHDRQGRHGSCCRSGCLVLLGCGPSTLTLTLTWTSASREPSMLPLRSAS